ncbi:CENPX protein, partial [Loxia curvirostra]|nr:CENPX protein [Loxia curvirostra]
THPFLSPQDTVDRLLRLHFRDGRTRGTGAAAAGGSGRALASCNRLVLAVNADAQLLMAELLKVFVRGERAGPPQPWSDGLPAPPEHRAALHCSHPSHCPSLSSTCTAEAAARAARQAQAEDLNKVDTEQLEKVLPQLVCNW